MSEDQKNEFDNLDIDDEAVPLQTISKTTDEAEDIIASGRIGKEYDYNNAPNISKAPPRIDLNGKTVIIKEAKIPQRSNFK